MICPICTIWFCTDPACNQRVSYRGYRKTYYETKDGPERRRKRKENADKYADVTKDLIEILLKLGEPEPPI